MTNPQQPELRRNEESPATKQRTQDAKPTEPPHGGPHSRAEDRPVPEDQTSPYGPS
ncbi:hypothetical protein Ade02nite_33710 [Paractinoplanes deccanensis]|uniref:Uncharacterized protein n=1 Tax=Paractinoplanes deccanensis TaxID=113561 RepID=A0ABQ3Y4D6_9ACTN|nr:hypothetical protein [Actinoplanes deccanensis]GID74730.1 hypothetical protein Ade02nite_33710 [Actinoplanes deccanensis]